MPHVVYVGAFILCPWPDCDLQIELVDFQLELVGDPTLYAAVMASGACRPDFGLIGRCPGCRRHVWFGPAEKRSVPDPLTTGLPILPDDWRVQAYVA